MLNTTRKNTIVLLSLADLSISNGQGVFGRKVLSEICDALDSPSDDVFLIAPDPENPTMLQQDFRLPNEKVASLPRKKNRSIFWHMKVQLLIIIYLFKLRPQSVVFSVKPSLIGVEFARVFLGFEKIILVEGLGKNSLKKLGGSMVVFFGNLTYRVLFRKAKSIFVAYESAARWVREYKVACDVSVIPCGVDTEVFNPKHTSENIRLRDDTINIGYVGSFRDVHRLDILVQLLFLNPNFNLTLIGSGYVFEDIRDQIARFKLGERVQFLGELAQEEIPKAIASCHLMWAYTDLGHWGVPIKAFEYLACNKLVIVSERPEFSFVSENGYGLVLDIESPEQISFLLNDFVSKQRNSGTFKIDSFDYISIHHNWQNYRKVADFVF